MAELTVIFCGWCVIIFVALCCGSIGEVGSQVVGHLYEDGHLRVLNHNVVNAVAFVDSRAVNYHVSFCEGNEEPNGSRLFLFVVVRCFQYPRVIDREIFRRFSFTLFTPVGRIFEANVAGSLFSVPASYPRRVVDSVQALDGKQVARRQVKDVFLFFDLFDRVVVVEDLVSCFQFRP